MPFIHGSAHQRRTSFIRAAWVAGSVLLFAQLICGAPTAALAEGPPLASKTSGEIIPLSQWQNPPAGARPLARWWWPGGSVDREGLTAQLAKIDRAGFGAVEVQPLLLGLGASDIEQDPRLRSVGSPSFSESLAHAAQGAAALGFRFDLTLGSGWPGGLPTSKRNAERQLLLASLDIDGPVHFTGPLPPAPDQSDRTAVEWILDVLGPPDTQTRRVAVLAAELGPSRDGRPTFERVHVLGESRVGAVADEIPGWDIPAGRWRIFAFYENSTGHFVMGGAFPGQEPDALVIDHLSARGADALLDGYAKPLLGALEPGQVRALFVDSFESMGELPFTAELLDAFEERMGYSLTPHLPLVFRKGGESKYAEMMDVFGRNGGALYETADPLMALRIREDYESVRAQLFEERFIDRIVQWSHAHGVELRLQAHGGYADYLDVYARADVPESEALFAGGSFDFLKLAASAAHVSGRPFASSESFITLRLWGTRLSFDEMRMLAGRAYSAGINRLAFHGVPYPYLRADGETWYPFSGGFGRILAGPLPMSSQIDDAFLAKLPDFNRFLSRLTLAMSQGQPAADVAWFRSEPIHPDQASLQVRRIVPHDGESPVTATLRARGLVHDRVSPRMLAAARTGPGGQVQIGAGRYKALLLDPMETAEPELVESVAALAEAGVPVIALGALPERATGWRDADKRDQRVREAVARIVPLAIRVKDPGDLETILARYVPASIVGPAPGERLEVSLDRRHNEAGETILVVNESWSATRTRLHFTRAGGPLTLWDPRSGTRRLLRGQVEPGDTVEFEMQAAESLILSLASPSASAPNENSTGSD